MELNTNTSISNRAWSALAERYNTQRNPTAAETLVKTASGKVGDLSGSGFEQACRG
jgi:hypothetical protein